MTLTELTEDKRNKVGNNLTSLCHLLIEQRRGEIAKTETLLRATREVNLWRAMNSQVIQRDIADRRILKINTKKILPIGSSLKGTIIFFCSSFNTAIDRIRRWKQFSNFNKIMILRLTNQKTLLKNLKIFSNQNQKGWNQLTPTQNF